MLASTTFFKTWEPPRPLLYATLLLLVFLASSASSAVSSLFALFLAFVAAAGCLMAETQRVVAPKHAIVENTVCMFMLATSMTAALTVSNMDHQLRVGLFVLLIFAMVLFLYIDMLSMRSTRHSATIMLFLVLDGLVVMRCADYPTLAQWYLVARTLQTYVWIGVSIRHDHAKQPYWFRTRKRALSQHEEPLAWHYAMKRQAFEDVVASVQAYEDKGHTPRPTALKTMFNGMSMPALVEHLTTAFAYLTTFSDYDNPKHAPIVLALQECMEELDNRASTAWMMARSDQELLDMLGTLGPSTPDPVQTLELPSLDTIHWIGTAA